MKRNTSFLLTLSCLIICGLLINAAPDTSVSNAEVINVTNETEFVNAIGPNRVIQLAPGTYNLSLAGKVETGSVKWEKTLNTGQMVIRDVENLSIIGMGEEQVKVYIANTYAYVLTFRNARNITIKNIEAGHFPGKGFCTGGVVC